MVLVPGMGDDVQAFKAGIMEIADIFVINKADHAGAGASGARDSQLQSMGHRADGWMPPIVRTVATDGTGIDELLAAIEQARGIEKQRLPVAGSLQIDHLGIAVKSIEAGARIL